MKLTLTANEGRKVLDALVDVALAHGWNEDELEESGVLEEYSAAVDAAMEAMGLGVNIIPDDDEEEEEEEDDFDEEVEEEFNAFWDEDEDEDENTEAYSLTAKGEFVLLYMDAGYSFEEACEVADELFGQGE